MRKIFIGIAGMFLLATSCQKQDLQSTNADAFKKNSLTEYESLAETKDVEAIDQNRKVFARALSSAIQDEPFRLFLRSQIAEKNNGDFEILYPRIADRQLPDGRVVHEILAQHSEESPEFFGAELVVVDPLLTIYAHMETNDIISWEADEIPTVGVIPFEADEATPFDVEAFENGTQISSYSSQEAPTTEVLVLKSNERYSVVRKSTNTLWGSAFGISDILSCLIDALVFENGVYQYFSFQQFIECLQNLNSGGGSGTGDPEPDCGDRDTRNKKDRYDRMKFNSENALEDAESWWGGDIEMRFIVAIVDGTAGNPKKVEKYWQDEREDWYNSCNFWGCSGTKWYSEQDLEIVTWEKEDYGDAMHYEWLEVDRTDWTTEITIGVSSKFKISGVETSVNAGVKFMYNPKDDQLGSSIVEYCDPANLPIGYNYNTGTLQFSVYEAY
jgi:hypothetical protein